LFNILKKSIKKGKFYRLLDDFFAKLTAFLLSWFKICIQILDLDPDPATP